ncbi:sodium:proton antiporter NhaD [Simkania negevensis]|uniref:Sodium:proton antiporter NhaD n=1 Tax=Simkania negevensis TaxID=83561 RepID=A0ABS3AS11_9BACT|nr:sodium:proton antiporter NhaD [Simkania negevensis]
MVGIFLLGYVAIIFEHTLKINKAGVALLMAALCWMFYFISHQGDVSLTSTLGSHLSSVSEIVFFLLGAMTIVELVDSHKGFAVITRFIQTRSKRKMLWIVGFLTFFLSSLLDNLTTTILMVSILRKLIPESKDRLVFGSMVVIASNAGGAWTPIGDVTTTMLWINGQVTTFSIIKSLFIPSLVCLCVALGLQSFFFKGVLSPAVQGKDEMALSSKKEKEPGALLIFIVGMAALIFVPIFKALTHLPPFMGMLVGMGIMWLVTDLIHSKYHNRSHLRVPYILSRIDTSSVLFFLGILLTINALEAHGLLEKVAYLLDKHIGNVGVIATTIGLASAVIDNVPLVAAAMGMYDLASYPTNDTLWELIAYCAGTGGSILIIGSAAGVAFMGMENVSFISYFKKASLIATISYFAGIITYLATNALLA